MGAAELALTLLLLVAVSGVVVRFVPLPLPILQIALGVIAAWPTGGLHAPIDPELFLLLFVPPLLFIDGFLAPKREFTELKVPILGLAFGLVVMTVVVLGYTVHWLVPAVPLPVAFALAAVLSPTDAVAVGEIVGRGRVPARLLHVLQGEALLNDASALVTFRFAVAAALTGQFSVVDTALSFLLVAAGGIAAGFASLWATARVLRLVARIGSVEAQVQVLAVLLLPFAAYLLAEHFGASGILAAVTAGIYLGRSGLISSLSVPARLQNGTLMEMMSFSFNGVIFLLLGLQLPEIMRHVPPELSPGGSSLLAVLVVVGLTLVLILVRFLWVALGVTGREAFAWFRGRPTVVVSTRVKVVTALAGVRGAITLAGVLSLPLTMLDGTAFPARDLSIFVAAGVIVCSLGLASLALPWLTRGLDMPESDILAEEERLARVTAAEAAIATIERMVEESRDDAGLFASRQSAAENLIIHYRQRIVSTGQPEAEPEGPNVAAAANEMHVSAMQAERVALRRLLAERRINDEILHRLFGEIILVEAFIERRGNGRG